VIASLESFKTDLDNLVSKFETDRFHYLLVAA